MKKLFLTAMSLWIIGSIYAQVGVNTETPATTFHVLPGKTDSSTAEGIIAPNLKRSEVIAKDSKYTTAQTGAMVYVSDLSGVLTTKTAKIITTGYYYFDGALWQPFTSGAAAVTTANNGLTMNGTTTQLGGALIQATSITGTSQLTLATPTTVSGDLQYSEHGAASGMVLSSDASGNATWKDQNMLSGSWFYVPSINLDMSTATQKTVNIFTLCVQQLTAATTPIAASSGYVRPSLPTTATAYDYMVIDSSGHITGVSISTSGVMTYTPTTTNPPPFAYVNIIVRVK